jgi:molybdopterin synthase catalytic subunit
MNDANVVMLGSVIGRAQIVNHIDAAEVIAWVSDPKAGGVGVFLGTTRSELRSDGVPLLALDYEAHSSMALAQLNEVLSQARARWPIVKAAVLHKVGRVALGEASVLVAVSTPHRGESFEACRFIIDELKKSVPIWKKEVWADEKSSWVHPGLPREVK